jgi:hypothetical protein
VSTSSYLLVEVSRTDRIPTPVRPHSRRPPKAVHLPSYEKLLSEDEARDKKIAERIAALHVEKVRIALRSE